MPFSIVADDLNHDRALDLAVAVQIINGPPPHPGRVAVILQNPAAPGKFLAAKSYPTQNDPIFIAAGDLNQDGWADLVVGSESSSNIGILIQNPSQPGTFLPLTRIPVGNTQAGIAIGDLNSDGLPDIAVALGTRNLAILFQDPMGPPGSFLPATHLHVNEPAFSVAIGDLDGDGESDLALVLNTKVGVLLQDKGVPGFFPSESDYAVGPQPVAVKIADVNGDSIPDLVVADLGTPSLSGGGISLLLQDVNARGTFLPSKKYKAGRGPEDVAVADLNGDGRADFAVANFGSLSNTGSVSVLLQKRASKGGIGFKRTRYPGKTGPTALVIGDFNGDGRQDIAVADGPTATIMFQRPTKPGTFLAPRVVGR